MKRGGNVKIITADINKCVGCHDCEHACAYHYTRSTCEEKWSNIQVNDYVEERSVVPMTCFQCERAWCMEVCPTHALVRDEETGAVVVQAERCIGCKMCMRACPFGNMHFDPIRKISRKCDLCGGDPRCVEHCVAGALQYEEVEELAAAKRRKVDSSLKGL